jgi:hypothetical protein
MLADEPSHVLRLVARGVIDEEYDALRAMPLRMLKDRSEADRFISLVQEAIQ